MPSVLGAFNQIFHRKDKSKILLDEKKSKENSLRRRKPIGTTIRCYPMRLADGVELVSSITQLMKDVHLQSLIVINTFGNVSSVRINEKDFQKKHFQIIALNGSFTNQNFHLFGSLWDEDEQRFHCGSISSLIVSKSCEILLAEPIDVEMHRYIDPQSKENLLFVQNKSLTDL